MVAMDKEGKVKLIKEDQNKKIYKPGKVGNVSWLWEFFSYPIPFTKVMPETPPDYECIKIGKAVMDSCNF